MKSNYAFTRILLSLFIIALGACAHSPQQREPAGGGIPAEVSIADESDLDPKFGAEFTFKPAGNPDETAYDRKQRRADTEKFFQRLLRRAKTRKPTDANFVVIDVRSATVTYPNLDGFFFTLGTDPDVIEVTTKPVTVNEAEKVAKYIESDLFKWMEGQGLEPHRYEGAGHIHASEPRLKSNSRLFRNVIVDTVNQWELGSGVLGDNRADGYGPVLNYKKYDASYEDYFDINARKVINPQLLETRIRVWNEAVTRIDTTLNKNEVLLQSDIKAFLSLAMGNSKNTALNINHEETVEFRWHRPQKSYYEFVDYARLYKGRMNFLWRNFHSTLVPLRTDFPEITSVEGKKGAQAYRNYVEQSGQNWEKLKTYLPTKYQDAQTRPYTERSVLPFGVSDRPVLRQCTGSSCGLAAVSNSLAVWEPNMNLDQNLVFDQFIKGTKWEKKLKNGGIGLTVEELKQMTTEILAKLEVKNYVLETYRFPDDAKTPAGKSPSQKVEDYFRAQLKKVGDGWPNTQMVIEFNPEVIWKGAEVEVDSGSVGHFVYIERYDPKTDRVLISDPYPEYPSQYWISTKRLLTAINTMDDDVANRRKGFMLLTLPEKKPAIAVLRKLNILGIVRCSSVFGP